MLILTWAVAAWTHVAAAISGGDPVPFSALLFVCVSVFLLARLTASVHWSLVPAVVVAIAAVLTLSTPDIFSPAPLSGPFGYANAKGAFFVQAAIAGLMLASAPGPGPARVLGVTAAVAFGAVPFAAKSLTAAALILFLPGAALAAQVWIGVRVVVLSLAVVFIAALSTTIVLGSTYTGGIRSGLVDRLVDATLTERRAALWHEALVMMGEHPVTGVGLGGFQALSPTAQMDRDARWAHNSFLQHGAETGVLGLLLLGWLFLWGFAGLGVTKTPNVVAVLGAVAAAALGIHASVDYVLHFPAVPITTAALVGTARGSFSRLERLSTIVGRSAGRQEKTK